MKKKINICTWNLLNPEPSISFMSWKAWVCQAQAVCESKQSKSKISPHTIASIDYERFVNFRAQAIINILTWMISKSHNPLVICLQEVHPLLLDKLKNLVSPSQIAIGQETQSNNLVTLVTKGTILSTQQIQLGKKITIVSKIKFNNFDQIISCANIHFYWKWSDSQIIQYGQELVSNLSSPFVIAGDFNKPINMLGGFMDLFDCVLHNESKLGYTSTLTHTSKLEFGQIDHIMFSSEFVIGDKTKYKILNKVLNYNIFYKFSKVIKLFDMGLINNSIDWIKIRSNSDISDHKAVFVKNIYI